jgi:prevent-host-death family protein
MRMGEIGRRPTVEDGSLDVSRAALVDEPVPVNTVGIRELARHVSSVVADVIESGQPTVVTKHGAAVAVIVPIRPGAVGDHSLSRAIECLESIAHDDLEAGAPTFADQLARLAEALKEAEPRLRRVS